MPTNEPKLDLAAIEEFRRSAWARVHDADGLDRRRATAEAYIDTLIAEVRKLRKKVNAVEEDFQIASYDADVQCALADSLAKSLADTKALLKLNHEQRNEAVDKADAAIKRADRAEQAARELRGFLVNWQDVLESSGVDEVACVLDSTAWLDAEGGSDGT